MIRLFALFGCFPRIKSCLAISHLSLSFLVESPEMNVNPFQNEVKEAILDPSLKSEMPNLTYFGSCLQRE